MDLTLVKAAADYATGVLRSVAGQKKETREQWKLAVSKLQEAVLQTRLYVSSLDRGNPIDRAEEQRLVALWSAAAGGFYTLDSTLAERLQLKAEYWTQPESWTSEQVREAGIALQHVAERTRQLLREGK
jgi:hypothetical protein